MQRGRSRRRLVDELPAGKMLPHAHSISPVFVKQDRVLVVLEDLEDTNTIATTTLALGSWKVSYHRHSNKTIRPRSLSPACSVTSNCVIVPRTRMRTTSMTTCPLKRPVRDWKHEQETDR